MPGAGYQRPVFGDLALAGVTLCGQQRSPCSPGLLAIDGRQRRSPCRRAVRYGADRGGPRSLCANPRPWEPARPGCTLRPGAALAELVRHSRPCERESRTLSRRRGRRPVLFYRPRLGHEAVDVRARCLRTFKAADSTGSVRCHPSPVRSRRQLAVGPIAFPSLGVGTASLLDSPIQSSARGVLPLGLHVHLPGWYFRASYARLLLPGQPVRRHSRTHGYDRSDKTACRQASEVVLLLRQARPHFLALIVLSVLHLGPHVDGPPRKQFLRPLRASASSVAFALAPLS